MPADDTVPPARPGLIARRPWLLVVAAFLLLLCGWALMFHFALKFAPDSVAPAVERVEGPAAREGAP